MKCERRVAVRRGLRAAVVAVVMGLGWATSGYAVVAAEFDSPTLTAETGAIHDPQDATGTDYNGSLATMLALSLTVPQAEAVGPIESAELTVWVAHTFVGDLTVKLVSPSGTIITVLNRPGSGAPDDGSAVGGAGASADLSVEFPITFADETGLASAEDIGFGLGGGATVGQPPIASRYAPDNDVAAGVGPLTDIGAGSFTAVAGEDAAGTWTLYVADSGAFNSGYLQAWRLSLTMVPEPSSLILVAMGLGALFRRR